MSRITERAVTVLPQPDSPTRPRTWPFLTLKLTPSTARRMPSEVWNSVLRSSTFKMAGSIVLTGIGAMVFRGLGFLGQSEVSLGGSVGGVHLFGRVPLPNSQVTVPP